MTRARSTSEGTGLAVPSRVVLLCARDPAGERSGRKVVLETIARCLELLGHEVTVIALTRGQARGNWQGRPVHRVAVPGPLGAATGALRGLGGSGTLNEALFDSARVRRQVSRLVRDSGATLVIADTLRVAGPAAATGVPVIVHLDDLLSERYAAMLGDQEKRRDLLGYYGRTLPRPLRRPAATLAGALLAGEVEHLRAREIEVARTSFGAAMTSPAEAGLLSTRTGVTVAALPMAVDLPPVAWSFEEATPGSVVFLGSPGYGPNRLALDWWCTQVRPALDAAGAGHLTLTVVGAVEPAQRATFADSRLTFAGYVTDLPAELDRHRVCVAPTTEGGGIKTKILDAMAAGVPVVSTSMGVRGIPVVAGRHAWVADSAPDFAAAVIRACSDRSAAESVGRAGRDLIGQLFSTGVVADGWRGLLASGDRVQPR